MADNTQLYAYILLRSDMPSMGYGKAIAQAMHAGNHMTHELFVKPLIDGKNPEDMTVQWHQQGGGFGTAISLGGPDEITINVITSIAKAAEDLGFMAGIVIDETYPFYVDNETFGRLNSDLHTSEPVRTRDGWHCTCEEKTALWILGNKTDLQVLLARFNLTPNNPIN